MLDTREKKYRSWILTALCGAVFLVLTGCETKLFSKDENVTLIDTVLEANGTQELQLNEAEIPRCVLGVLTDQNGYAVGSEKKVAFRGTRVSDSFSLVDAVTDEVVYSGEIIAAGTSKNSDEYTYTGDFTDFEVPGQYYVVTDYLGESVEFEISNQLYDAMRQRLLMSFYYARCGYEITEEESKAYAHDACHTNDDNEADVLGGWHTDGKYGKDTSTGALAVAYLLTAYELNPDAFDDGLGMKDSGNQIPDLLDEAAYEMTWLLRMQEDSGGVSAGLIREEIADGTNPAKDDSKAILQPVTDEATYLFAAAAAQFGRIYHAYDTKFADSCLYAAEEAYRYAQTPDCKEQYAAATQLYKTTGKYEYGARAEAILRAGDILTKDADDACVFLADIAYLTIPRKTDAALCEGRMELFTGDAKNLLERTANESYLVLNPDNYDITAVNDILNELQYTAFVNHIITNREYRTAIEGHLHFLSGRNRDAVNYITDAGVRRTLQEDESGYYFRFGEDITDNARLLFILGIYI